MGGVRLPHKNALLLSVKGLRSYLKSPSTCAAVSNTVIPRTFLPAAYVQHTSWLHTVTAFESSSNETFKLSRVNGPAISSVGFDLPFAVRVYASSPLQPTSAAASAKKEVEEEEEKSKHTLNARKSGFDDSTYWGIVPKKFTREDGTDWPWNSFRPADTYAANLNFDLTKHFKAKNFGDWFAYYLVKSLRIPTDIFFRRRYGCRAMMLETVAAVPGMVGGMLLHLESLRRFQHTGGWIRALLDEAENERMHLMTFMEVAKPNWAERLLVLAVQGVFFNAYFLSYLIAPRVAHRVVGYLEEEAIHSYTEFLKEIDAGRIENVPAPSIAIDYWRLPQDARLRDVVLAVRVDEAHHRDVNHFAANVIQSGEPLRKHPAPMDYH